MGLSVTRVSLAVPFSSVHLPPPFVPSVSGCRSGRVPLTVASVIDRSDLSIYLSILQLGRDDCPHRDNIRVLEMDASEALGPCWARHLQVLLSSEG